MKLQITIRKDTSSTAKRCELKSKFIKTKKYEAKGEFITVKVYFNQVADEIYSNLKLNLIKVSKFLETTDYL